MYASRSVLKSKKDRGHPPKNRSYLWVKAPETISLVIQFVMFNAGKKFELGVEFRFGCNS